MLNKVKNHPHIMQTLNESRAERAEWVNLAVKVSNVSESVANQDWMILNLIENHLLIQEQEEKFKKIINEQEEKFKKIIKEAEDKYQNYKKQIEEKIRKYKKESSDMVHNQERQFDEKLKKVKK